MSMTDEQIRELCNKATEGPWEVKDSTWIVNHPALEHVGIADMGGEGWIGIISVRPRAEEADIEDDAAFIAAARELVPRLLERAQKADARIVDLVAARDHFVELLAESQRRERAAVEDLEQLAGQSSLCGICKYLSSKESDLICADCKGKPHLVVENFEWRGPQADKGAEK